MHAVFLDFADGQDEYRTLWERTTLYEWRLFFRIIMVLLADIEDFGIYQYITSIYRCEVGRSKPPCFVKAVFAIDSQLEPHETFG